MSYQAPSNIELLFTNANIKDAENDAGVIKAVRVFPTKNLTDPKTSKVLKTSEVFKRTTI